MAPEALSLSLVVNKISEELVVHAIKHAFHELMEKRQRQGREILLEEIRSGNKDICDIHEVDEVVAITYRYMRAAQEGTAKANLRLLARIISGQNASGSLKASDFLYYADIIAALRHEEIALLGTMKRFPFIYHKENNLPEISQITKQVMDELISRNVFESEEEFYATAKSLERTGFLMATVASTYECRTPCFLTPLFKKVSKLASFEDIEN